MRAKGVIIMGIAGINGNKSLAFELIDNEGIHISFIIGSVSDKESTFFEFIDTLEFFNQFTGDVGIRDVIGKSG